MRRVQTFNSNAQPILSIPSKNINATAPSKHRKIQNSTHQPTSKCSIPDKLERESTTRLSPSNSYSTGSTSTINAFKRDCTLAPAKFTIEEKSFIKKVQPTHHSIQLPSSILNFFVEKSNKSVSIFSSRPFSVSCNKNEVQSPQCSKPLICLGVEVIDSNDHHQTFHHFMSLQQMLQKLTDQIYCTKALDSNQNNSKCVTMLCTKQFRQIKCTYNCYKVLFEETYNQLWITTVF